MLYVLVHSLLRNFSFLVSGSSHPIHDDVPEPPPPHSTCKVSAEDMICFQNSTAIKGKEAEEALGRYRRAGITKDMKILPAEGNEIELDEYGRRKRDSP